MLAIGRNYQKHAEEGARALNTEVGPPTIFTKAITTISGPYDDIPIDASVSDSIDWEVELGVVVGRSGRNIKRQDALDHVFGYTVVNDVTARDIQHGWGGQWFKGKSLDGSCPTGPWVLTADEVPDPHVAAAAPARQRRAQAGRQHPGHDLPRRRHHRVAVDGHDPPARDADRDRDPRGRGLRAHPPEFLRPGDVMETEVEGVGSLRNRVVAFADFGRS